ncbi:MAG TPA: 2-C-methyl-D-erythritol 2,4-cyclodiphosphate synthase [Actinomycetota bacterium]|nr:2-C-methyl-D-erythritol 2,4-cyclodiphosphate synthase [Actinomycetota bacterium]
MRVGMGYDVHAFEPGRPLVLGGVTIPDATGLAGHSDADVVCHAIADALLGASGLGDLGTHFAADAVPEGVSSLQILARTAVLLAGAGFTIVNVDATVVIQEVRMAPYRRQMAECVAAALGIEPAQVSVKATTTDHLGFAGRGEGAAGLAVALVDGGPSR